MNLLLFDEEEVGSPLLRGDDRFIHIQTILKSKEGDTLDAGVVNGKRGIVVLKTIAPDRIEYEFLPGDREEAPLKPLTMIIGCPRPPTARRLVKDLASLGVGRLVFSDTDLNEKSYLQARFWRDGLYEGALREGAMQGKSTQIPPVDRYFSLKKALESLEGGETRLVPDLPGGPKLSDALTGNWPADRKAVAAIGPERGWTDRERDMLADQGFQSVTLGDRVMRTESAALMTAGSILLAML
ncbi:MAG: RNA methyltransferase [Spirochaetales bacterium]|nr:RNA methyltransferase [Spirochaetales bacterium]